MLYCTYLCREFHTDGRSLSVLNAQRSYNGIGISLQAAHFKHGFNTVHSSVTAPLAKLPETTHYASFSLRGTEGGWRNFAEKSSASRTVL
jgi:hypothetical protein